MRSGNCDPQGGGRAAFRRLFKNTRMRGSRWFDKLTMTDSLACPEPVEGPQRQRMRKRSRRMFWQASGSMIRMPAILKEEAGLTFAPLSRVAGRGRCRIDNSPEKDRRIAIPREETGLSSAPLPRVARRGRCRIQPPLRSAYFEGCSKIPGCEAPKSCGVRRIGMYAATTKDEETKQTGVLADIRIIDPDVCDPQGGDWAVIRSLASHCEARSLSDSTAAQKFSARTS